MNDKRTRLTVSRIACLALLLAAAAGTAWAENHDLVIQPAIDVSSSASADWKSPDIKIGADFGDTSVPDIVRRGISSPIYSRFYINGIQDFMVPSGSVELRLHYRDANLGDTPPALDDSNSSWHMIGTLPVTFIPSDGPFAITKTWPDDFPSVTTKSIAWDAPPTGDYFHIRSEVAYLESSNVTDENLDDNVAVSFYESLSGLIDVVLVHDTSGSMGYFFFEGLPYIDHSKARASAYIYALSDTSNRFAVVEFSSRFPGGSNDVWPVPGSLEPATTTNKNSAVAAIGGLTASGATPMGAGLQRAIDLLLAPPPDGITRKKVILLLSDGYENQGVLRACSGADPSAPCVGESILTQLQANNIRVFSLALGTAAWTECLECLATESSGEWYPTPDPGIVMAEVYLHAQHAYSVDDLYSVDRGTSGGGDDSYSTYFEGVDDILYFILSWDDLEAQLNLQLQDPGGSWSDPSTLSNAMVFSGNGYVVVRIAKTQTGNWEYRVTGDDGERYLVAVRSDRVGVCLAVDARSKGFVGDAIDIKARLSRHGKPIVDAKLNATVQVPAHISLDSKLRQLSRDYILKNQTLPLDPADLKQNPDIWQRASFISKITSGKPESLVQTRPVSVALNHVGDGVYSGSMKNATKITGAYTVTVNYSNQGINRTQSRPVWLKPGVIDQGRSYAEIVEIKPMGDATQWLLRVYPVDRFDNAITDTSLLQQVKVSINGGHVDKTPKVVFDSAFQQPIIAEPDSVPRLQSVSIGGKKLKIIEDDVLDEDPGYGLIIVITLILIALALAWLWRRRTQAS